MPWRDVGVVVHGSPARDLARHFIQRWNFTKVLDPSHEAGGREGAWGSSSPPSDSAIPLPQTTKAKYKIPRYPYLLPKSTSTANQLPFMLPGVQCATVQVRLRLQPALASLPSAQCPGPLSLT